MGQGGNRVKQIARVVLSVVVLGTMGGCKIYTELPMDRKAKDAALSTPDLPRIQVQAGELKHPLLKPLTIDLSDGLSPDEAAVLAVLLNPDLKSVRDQRALATAQLLEVGLLPDPILSFSQDFPLESNGPGYVTAQSTQLGFDLTSLLTRGLRRSAAKAAQLSVDLDVAWQEWQVAEAAKLSVYRILALDPQADLADEAVAALGEILHAVEKASVSGEMSQGDVASARIGFDIGQRNALSTRQSRDRERQALNALLGLPPHEQLALEKPMGRPLKKRPWNELPSEQLLIQGLDQRLDLVALQKGYDSQDARLRLAIWSQFPSIGISLSRAQDTSNVATGGYGVAVSLPLFNRGQGLVAMENATRQQLYDQYLARLFHARSDVAQIFSDIKAVKEMIATAQAALPVLEAQAEASRAAFAGGNLDLLTRNQNKLSVLSQRAAIASLRANLDDLGVALELASGRTLQPKEGPR